MLSPSFIFGSSKAGNFTIDNTSTSTVTLNARRTGGSTISGTTSLRWVLQDTENNYYISAWNNRTDAQFKFFGACSHLGAQSPGRLPFGFDGFKAGTLWQVDEAFAPAAAFPDATNETLFLGFLPEALAFEFGDERAPFLVHAKHGDDKFELLLAGGGDARCARSAEGAFRLPNSSTVSLQRCPRRSWQRALAAYD